MSYNELMTLIDACVNRNGVHAITGRVMNGVLKAMVRQLGAGYALGGVAHLADDPGTPDAPICYFASEEGTYTNFGGLTIAAGEFALFCFDLNDGWSKETIYEGITEIHASIDDQVGTPEVDVTYQNGILSFDFRNMKGNTGDAAGFGTISADVDANIGTPAVSVSTSGPDTAKVIAFHFRNLKGETGVTSVVATVDNTTGNPACAVSLNGQELHLDFTGLKGAQGNTGVSADYPIAIINNLTDGGAASALSAEMGKELAQQLSQLDLKVGGILGTETYKEAIEVNQAYWVNTNNVREATSNWKSSLPIHLYKGDFIQAKLGYGYAYDRGLVYYTDATMSYFFQAIGTNKITTQQNITFTATQECYILIQSANGLLGDCYIIRDSKRLVGIEYELNAIQNVLDSPLYLNSILLNQRYWINTNGVREASTNWYSSLPVHLNPGDKVIANVGYVYEAVRGLLYITDAEMSFFTQVIGSDGSTSQQTISYTAENECYVIVQSGKELAGDCYLFADSKRIIAIEGLLGQIENETLEPWVKSELERIINILDSKQTDDIIVIAFNSDQHINCGKDNSTVMRGLWAMNHLSKKTALNLICLGGDSAGYDDYNTYERVARDMADVTGAVDTDACPVVSIAGNHEANTNFYNIPIPDGRYVFNGTLKKAAVKKILLYFESDNTNCYYDDLAARVRFVFLDQWSQVSPTRYDGVLQMALADEKLYNGEWSVIFISHNVIKAVGNNTQNPIPNSVWEYISGKMGDGLNVIMCINGHSHYICQGVSDGVPFFGSTQARLADDATASYDGITYIRKPNSPTETSFDVYLIDRTEHKIYALQYGAGSDRLFNSATGQFEYCTISGQVTLSGGGSVAGGTITATYHNTVHSATLDATGNYQFNYLCPGRPWKIEAVVGSDSKSVTVNSVSGTITQDIEIEE